MKTEGGIHWAKGEMGQNRLKASVVKVPQGNTEIYRFILKREYIKYSNLKTKQAKT